MSRVIATFLLIVSIICAYGQSVDWLVAPQYSEIQYFAPQIYKVTKDSKVGLIKTDGTIIVPVEYDEISLFYEGRAIFADRSSEGWKIMGVVSDNGKVRFTRGDYYLLNDYQFFSEGFITVKDSNGRFGYLNENCQPAFDFTNNIVRPFSEGFAAIGEEDDFHWINTSGEKIWLRLKNGGTPYGGTNFYEGRAYLWDEDGIVFELGADGKPRKMKGVDHFDIDYLYRVGSGKGEKEEYTVYKQQFSEQWKPECKNGKWSYMSSTGHLLCPFIYDEAKKFSGGVAVASVNGLYGLLHVVSDDATFSTQNKNNRHVFSAGSDCNCDFQLSVPEKWRNQSISVTLTDAETGNKISIESNGNNNYTFTYNPSSSNSEENREFVIEVMNNGIQIWQGRETYSFVQRADLIKSIRVNNADADSEDRCMVTAIIKNPSPIDVNTTITLTGGGDKAKFETKTVTVTIAAYSSRSITSSFLVRNVELNGWCEVSTGEGTTVRRDNLELKPF